MSIYIERDMSTSIGPKNKDIYIDNCSLVNIKNAPVIC